MTDASNVPQTPQTGAPLPCPFCDGEIDVLSTQDQPAPWWWFVECDVCYARGPREATKAAAIASWNSRRASPPEERPPTIKSGKLDGACVHGASVCEPCAYDRGVADTRAEERSFRTSQIGGVLIDAAAAPEERCTCREVMPQDVDDLCPHCAGRYIRGDIAGRKAAAEERGERGGAAELREAIQAAIIYLNEQCECDQGDGFDDPPDRCGNCRHADALAALSSGGGAAPGGEREPEAWAAIDKDGITQLAALRCLQCGSHLRPTTARLPQWRTRNEPHEEAL